MYITNIKLLHKFRKRNNMLILIKVYVLNVSIIIHDLIEYYIHIHLDGTKTQARKTRVTSFSTKT